MKGLRILFISLMIALNVFQFVPVILHATTTGSSSIPPNRSLLLVGCSGDPLDSRYRNGERECTFNDVVREIGLLINFAFLAAVPVMIIALVYSGIRILFAQGNTGELTKAKEMMWMIIKGILIIMFAWLIVYAIVKSLLQPQFYNMFLGER